VSERSDLVSTLLTADATERERLLRSVDPTTLEMALPQLGRRREPAAAEVLALIDLVVEDRAVRKAARRELHRLRSIGVQAPETAPLSAAAGQDAWPRAANAPLPVSEAWATDIDPSGSRAVWLLGERPLGGVWFAALLLNDQRGLQDLSLIDTTRKRFLREFEASQRGGGIWVSVPGLYALALLREAVDLTRANSGGLPTRYHALRDVFGEAPSSPERALIYETISPVEANFNPGWLDDSVQLVSEPEVAGWHIPVGADFRQRALDAARAPSTGLLVPGHTPEQQVQQLVVDAAHDAFGPDVRRALRRRLEETAYIFAQTDRLAAARLAVGAAQGLEDGGTGSRVPAERHPLVRLLLASGLARLVGNERIGGHRAAEVLVELIERGGSREAQSAPVETRPSGLILPR
jgi:hypothetical protein